jgi:hypothetical protein
MPRRTYPVSQNWQDQLRKVPNLVSSVRRLCRIAFCHFSESDVRPCIPSTPVPYSVTHSGVDIRSMMEIAKVGSQSHIARKVFQWHGFWALSFSLRHRHPHYFIAIHCRSFLHRPSRSDPAAVNRLVKWIDSRRCRARHP